MGIMKCAVHSSLQAKEAYAEHGEEAKEDANLFNGKFFIDYVVRRAGRPCLDGTRRKRRLAVLIGKVGNVRPAYCRKTGAYTVGGWKVAGPNLSHETVVLSPLFSMEEKEHIFEVLEALKADGFLPTDGFTIHMISDALSRQTVLNMCNILHSRAELITRALRLQEELRFILSDDLAFTVMLDDFAAPETEACLYLLRQSYGMAAATGKARMKPCDGSNPKFQLRSWLLRLGFIGEEYERPRHTLLAGLEGDSAFFTENGKKRALEKHREEKLLEWMA